MVKPTLSIFSGSKGLNRIYREENQIVVPFSGFQLPLSGTEGNFEVNLKGKYRLIIVQGAHDGTGFDGVTPEQKLGDFIFEMEEWINAGTQTTRIYTDSFNNSYSVHCHDWSWTRANNDSNRIIYTMLLKEV